MTVRFFTIEEIYFPSFTVTATPKKANPHTVFFLF